MNMKIILMCVLFINFDVFSAVDKNEAKNHINDQKNKTNHREYDYDYNEEENEDDIGFLSNNRLADIVQKYKFFMKSADNNNDFGEKLSFNDTFYKQVSDGIKSVEVLIKQKFYEFLTDLEIPNECLTSITRIVNGMKRSELWAFKFLDSSPKMPSGITEGVSSFFGEYDQCLSIESTPLESDRNIFYGKYCLVTPNITLPSFEELEKNITFKTLSNKTNQYINELLKRKINAIKLVMASNFYFSKFTPSRFGICIPSNCEPKSIEKALNKVFEPIFKIPLEIGNKCDAKNEQFKYSVFQTFAIITLIVATILVTISTAFELFIFKCERRTHINNHIGDRNRRKNINNNKSFWTIFSIIRNTKSLYTNKNESNQCFHTMTFIFILWIHFGRYYIAPLTINLIGFKHVLSSFILKVLTDKSYFWIRTPFYWGTPFLFSGVFISVDFFSKKHEISIKSYTCFAIEKWLRFSIRCIGPILVLVTLSALGDGPMWNLGEIFFQKSCEKYYWMNLLQITNFSKKISDVCNSESNFLSIIFQLQIISPLIMVTLNKWPKFGLIFTIITAIFCCFVSLIPRIIGLPIAPFEVSDMNSAEVIERSINRYNYGTEQYLTPFLTGILIGYFIANKSKYNAFFNCSFTSSTLWILSGLLCSSAIIWGENFKDIDINPNKTNLFLWYSLGKILWASGLASFLFALCLGRKGIVYRFLSHDFFRPITQLNFTFLLLHNILMYYRFFTTRNNVEITHGNLWEWIFVDTFKTYILAYFIYVCIECPLNNLIKHFKHCDENIDQNLNNLNNTELKRLNITEREEIASSFD